MVSRLVAVEAIIHGQAAKAGRPVQARAGRISTAPITICPAIASAGCGLAFTAAFQPACSTALSKAART